MYRVLICRIDGAVKGGNVLKLRKKAYEENVMFMKRLPQGIFKCRKREDLAEAGNMEVGCARSQGFCSCRSRLRPHRKQLGVGWRSSPAADWPQEKKVRQAAYASHARRNSTDTGSRGRQGGRAKEEL
jgi:hypothetical protein